MGYAFSPPPPGVPEAGPPDFSTILFPPGTERSESAARPDCFVDLALDQIVAAVTEGRDEYDLVPFFHAVPHDLDTIAYRHEVMQDLEDGNVMSAVIAFCAALRQQRGEAAKVGKMHDKNQREASFLAVVKLYCQAVQRLGRDLARTTLRSRGLRAFRAYLDAYAGAAAFETLLDGIAALERDLGAISYAILIKDDGLTVRNLGDEPDYAAEIARTFAKFRQGDVGAHEFKFPDRGEINHVEGEVLKGVEMLHPKVFAALDAFFAAHARFVDPVIERFDREVNFYVAWLDFIATLKMRGLAFCYPRIATDDKDIRSRDGFDLALAHKLAAEDRPIVCNDFDLHGRERIFVVTGPNQGGKTTFARAFGQLHWLANLGCPVPGREARLFLFDRLFTHFEKEESLATLRGKLNDDLVRIHGILSQATPRTIVILNEIFNSTALEDATFLARKVLERIIAAQSLGVCVTFMDELASLGPETVSVASTVVPDNPAERTFKIVRKPADGLAYALSVAEKYRLTYARLKERLPA